jgi:hypothetical protein
MQHFFSLLELAGKPQVCQITCDGDVVGCGALKIAKQGREHFIAVLGAPVQVPR